MHFERNARVYERGRPPYPRALWRRLGELGFLAGGRRVLELGAGTGQATGPLVDAGLLVTALEPGPRLAERLRARYPDVDVRVQRAEDAELPAGAFDLAVAATSVHWMHLDVVLPALHRALVAGGSFLVWRNAFGDPSVDATEFRERVAAIVAARGPRPPRGPTELETDRWAAALSAGGYFAVADVEHFRWSVDLTDRQIHDLFSTFSDWTAPEVEEAARAVRDLGGTVTEHYVTPLIVLRRLERSLHGCGR